MNIRRATVILIVVGAVTACTGNTPPAEDLTPTAVPTATGPTPTPSPVNTPTPPATPPASAATPPATSPFPPETPILPPADPLVALATADLAERLEVSADEIQVVSVKPVQWRDASLGCPEPGMVYAQVVTPGFRIVLEADEETVEYHTDTRQLIAYCETPASSDFLTLPPPKSADDRAPWQPVDIRPTVTLP